MNFEDILKEACWDEIETRNPNLTIDDRCRLSAELSCRAREALAEFAIKLTKESSDDRP